MSEPVRHLAGDPRPLMLPGVPASRAIGVGVMAWSFFNGLTGWKTFRSAAVTG